MSEIADQSRRRRRNWLWTLFAVTSVTFVGYVAYSARTACPAVQRGRLTDVEMVHSLALAPDGRTLFLAAYDGLLRGERLGQSWVPVQQKLCRTDVTAVAFAAAAPQRAYLAGHSLGVMVSDDAGNHFRAVPAGLPLPDPQAPGADVHALTVDPADAGRVYAWVVGAGLWTSPGGGQAWTPVRADALTVQDVYHLGAHPAQAGVLYAAGAGGVAASADGGRNWTPVAGWTGAAYSTAVRAGAPERLLVAAGPRGVLFTDDAGQTWRKGGNLAGEVTAVAVSPQNPNLVLAATATGKLFESRNGGELWSPR